MSSILVIEDDVAAAKLLEAALLRAGHRVDVARDLPAGREALHGKDHHLVILDVFMRGGSGLELLRYVRRDLASRVPVLVLTGQRQGTVQARAEAEGATGFVTKPFSPQALLHEVERLTA